MKMKTLPKPTGEYAVGTFTYTVENNREEALPAVSLRDRRRTLTDADCDEAIGRALKLLESRAGAVLRA